MPGLILEMFIFNEKWLAEKLVGWENGIRTEKYMKMDWKRWFCVEAFV